MSPFLQERGLEKESQLAEQLVQKELEEEKARIPKAIPYPYAIDYPVVRSIIIHAFNFVLMR